MAPRRISAGSAASRPSPGPAHHARPRHRPRLGRPSVVPGVAAPPPFALLRLVVWTRDWWIEPPCGGVRFVWGHGERQGSYVSNVSAPRRDGWVAANQWGWRWRPGHVVHPPRPDEGGDAAQRKPGARRGPAVIAAVASGAPGSWLSPMRRRLPDRPCRRRAALIGRLPANALPGADPGCSQEHAGETTAGWAELSARTEPAPLSLTACLAHPCC